MIFRFWVSGFEYSGPGQKMGHWGGGLHAACAACVRALFYCLASTFLYFYFYFFARFAFVSVAFFALLFRIFSSHEVFLGSSSSSHSTPVGCFCGVCVAFLSHFVGRRFSEKLKQNCVRNPGLSSALSFCSSGKP